MDSEIYALSAEVDDQGIAFEIALIICVQLDPGLASIYLFGYNTTAGEYKLDFFEVGVLRKVGDVDGGVLPFARLLGSFGLLGRN